MPCIDEDQEAPWGDELMFEHEGSGKYICTFGIGLSI